MVLCCLWSSMLFDVPTYLSTDVLVGKSTYLLFVCSTFLHVFVLIPPYLPSCCLLFLPTYPNVVCCTYLQIYLLASVPTCLHLIFLQSLFRYLFIVFKRFSTSVSVFIIPLFLHCMCNGFSHI